MKIAKSSVYIAIWYNEWKFERDEGYLRRDCADRRPVERKPIPLPEGRHDLMPPNYLG